MYKKCSECQKQFLYTTCSSFSKGLSLEFSCIELVIQRTICRHTYCGLVDAKIRASDKDLPVMSYFVQSLGNKLKSFNLSSFRQNMKSAVQV